MNDGGQIYIKKLKYQIVAEYIQLRYTKNYKFK